MMIAENDIELLEEYLDGALEDAARVNLTNRLAAEKLVARASQPADRRQVFVSLTPHGLALLEQLSTTHRAELRRIGPRLKDLLSALEV